MLCATVTLVAARCWLWGVLPGWLQTFLRLRLVKYTAAAIPLTVVGLLIYWIEVSVFDANKLAVRPFNWVLTTSIGFAINWAIWRERRSPKYSSGVKFYAVAVLCSVCSFSLFALLSFDLGLQYLLAQVVAGVAVGLPHYLVNNRMVFRQMKAAPV